MSMTLAGTLGATDGFEAEWVTWIGTLESWERNRCFVTSRMARPVQLGRMDVG